MCMMDCAIWHYMTPLPAPHTLFLSSFLPAAGWCMIASAGRSVHWAHGLGAYGGDTGYGIRDTGYWVRYGIWGMGYNVPNLPTSVRCRVLRALEGKRGSVVMLA